MLLLPPPLDPYRLQDLGSHMSKTFPSIDHMLFFAYTHIIRPSDGPVEESSNFRPLSPHFRPFSHGLFASMSQSSSSSTYLVKYSNTHQLL